MYGEIQNLSTFISANSTDMPIKKLVAGTSDGNQQSDKHRALIGAPIIGEVLRASKSSFCHCLVNCNLFKLSPHFGCTSSERGMGKGSQKRFETFGQNNRSGEWSLVMARDEFGSASTEDEHS